MKFEIFRNVRFFSAERIGADSSASLTPFGPQVMGKMYATKSPKTFYFLSMSSSDDINSKEKLFSLVENLFQCTRIAISAEPIPESKGYYFHLLMELLPSVLWKNVDAHFRAQIHGEFTLVPLHSFARGLKYILASEQNPLFWNYDRNKAVRMLELFQMRKKYSHLDVPNTGAITRGFND